MNILVQPALFWSLIFVGAFAVFTPVSDNEMLNQTLSGINFTGMEERKFATFPLKEQPVKSFYCVR